NGGGSGGDPGNGARGGRPGSRFGNKGKKTSECDEAHNGQTGNPGIPDPLSTGGTVKGNPGASGLPGKLAFEVIDPPNSKTCADLIPIAVTVTSIVPNTGARGATVQVTITGTGFGTAPALHQVQFSGFGVSATVTNVNATTLHCEVSITASAPQNARDVTVKVGLSASVVVPNGFTVV
ncbi:IPT/TIG domain-containing protein, partial [Ideonella sp.]|uniref:IPT/TIG domain-containing protein n=1 Tax=Ideonella sp. TaxID=1929293 RepID=UPI003BB4E7F3